MDKEELTLERVELMEYALLHNWSPLNLMRIVEAPECVIDAAWAKYNDISLLQGDTGK